MARPLKPLIRSGGFYPSRKWTPLVYAGGYTTANGGEEPAPPPIEKTITGNPIHILDALAKPAQALSVKLEPIQDLHGYGNPWPAGGGDNLLDFSTKSLSNVTITGTAQDFTITGNAASYNFVQFDILNFAGKGTIYLSSNATRTGTSSNAACFQLFYNDGTPHYLGIAGYSNNVVNAIDRGFSVPENATSAKLNVYANNATSGGEGITSRIQNLRLSTKTGTTWSPYENICPISGHTDADVTRTGVNVWDEEWELGSLNSNGQPRSSSTSIRCKNFIPVAPGQTYYMYSGSGKSNAPWMYGIDKSFLRRSSAYLANQAFTIPEDVFYIKIALPSTYGATYNNDISINYPSTDHDYHAYTGTTYPIPLGQTVYGGTLDVVTGVLTVTHRYMLADGVNVKTTGGYGAVGPKWLPCIILATADKADPSMPIVATSYLKTSGVNVQNDENSAVQGNKGAVIALHIGTMQGTDGTHGYNSADEVHAAVNAYLQQNPLQLCYELATPQTIQLTPQQVELLQGENNLWSDGEMTLVYLADGNASDVEALNILLGGRYVNNHEADEPTDREALDILLGGNTR